MKFENLFTTFDLSYKLYSAGMGNETLYSYFSDSKGGVTIKRGSINKKGWLIPTYTCEEILLKLPYSLNLGDDFYIGINKYIPEVNEYGYRIDDNNPEVELIIEKTFDDTNHRFIASYHFPGRKGRIGIKNKSELKPLYENSFYLPEALGKLFLLLDKLKLINKE